MRPTPKRMSAISATRELTKSAVDSAVRADKGEGEAIYLAIAVQREAAFGHAARARRIPAEALKLAPTSPGAENEALAFAMGATRRQPSRWPQDSGRRFPLDTRMQSLWLPAIQAQLALQRKNRSSALNASLAASPIELARIAFVLNLSCLYSAYVGEEAYRAAGKGNAATLEFQRIIDHNGIVWKCWTGALAHLGVARANALQSRTSQGGDADAPASGRSQPIKSFSHSGKTPTRKFRYLSPQPRWGTNSCNVQLSAATESLAHFQSDYLSKFWRGRSVQFYIVNLLWTIPMAFVAFWALDRKRFSPCAK